MSVCFLLNTKCPWFHPKDASVCCRNFLTQKQCKNSFWWPKDLRTIDFYLWCKTLDLTLATGTWSLGLLPDLILKSRVFGSDCFAFSPKRAVVSKFKKFKNCKHTDLIQGILSSLLSIHGQTSPGHCRILVSSAANMLIFSRCCPLLLEGFF